MSRSLGQSLRPALGAALAVLALQACGGTDAVPPADTTDDGQVIAPYLATVETTVLPSAMPTGSTTTVTCVGKDQNGAELTPELPLAYEVFDANDQMPDGVTIAANKITANFAGVVRVRCYYPGTPRVDDTSPVSLIVQPGLATTVETIILKTSIQAGDKVGVACSVRDALENSTAGDTVLRVSPDTGTSITGGKNIRFTKTGVFQVTCMLADQSLIGNDVAVTVAPAALADLQTVLSRDTIAPTEEVMVSCPGTDAYGNEVDLDKVITLPVDGISGLDSNRLRLTGTTAGVYPITCVPKEAFVKATKHPASLTVVPGAPASIQMDLDPDRAVYALGVRPKVSARLLDAWGNELSDVSGVTVTAGNDGTIKQTIHAGERVTLDAEGAWTITATSAAPELLTATRNVLVDASAPTIDITAPERAAMLSNGSGPFTVTGNINDATGGLDSILVNNTPRTVTHGQNHYELAMQVPAQHGLNRLTVVATDVQGQKVQLAQSYMLAPGWKSPAASFDDGIVARLTRQFIDDGNRSGKPDDLATIIERVVQTFDVASYIPSPVVQYAGYDVFLRNVKYDPPKVSLTPSRDLLLMHLDLEHLSIDVDAEGFIDVSGVVSADAIRVDVELGVTVVQGVPKVTAQAITVDIEGLNIDVHWSINWLIDLFTDTIREKIVSSFEDVLRDQIPPAVATALGSLALDQTFTVPGFLPGMQPLNVRLVAKTNNAVVDETGLTVSLATQVTAAKKVQWDTPGSMMRGGCFGVDGGMPAWNNGKKLTMALSLDVLNQVLHAVWQGGALEMSLGAEAFGDVDLSQYGVSDLSLQLSARMPPVLTDCRGPNLLIQLGELHITADLKLNGLPLSVDMIVAFETSANVTVDSAGSISIALGEIQPQDILIDITRVESDLFSEGQEDVLVSLLREQLLTKVLGNFGGQGLADFPLPSFDLGGLSPSLAGQTISIGDVELGRDAGYLLLQGNP